LKLNGRAAVVLDIGAASRGSGNANDAWTESSIGQITIFPNAAHDDIADAMSRGLIFSVQRADPT
jgi:phage terminase large subunit-like protein